MIVQTTECGRFGHPEFRLVVDEAVVLDVDMQFARRMFEEWVASGSRFSDDQTVQLGWSLLKVRANSDQTISLLEPDFVSRPINWVDSLTASLRHLRLHKDTCESFFSPEQLACPPLQLACIVCSRFGAATEIMMDRSEVEGQASGWFLGCREHHDHNDVNELEKVSVYEAVLRNHCALPYLGLPAGTMVATMPSAPTVFFQGERVPPRPGSFVARSFERSKRP